MINKIKSGALQFTVFIAVLIALLITALILYAYTFIYFKQQSKATIENIKLSNSGINFLLKQNSFTLDTLSLSLGENKNQSIKVQLSQWGVFQKGFVKTVHKKKEYSKIGIIGTLIDSEKSPTLYMQETYNPLTVVGKTKIKGNNYLPSQGIKTGYIAGESYYGSQLVYGHSEKSTGILPKVNNQCMTNLAEYISDHKKANLNFNSSIPNNYFVNSFKLQTLNIYRKQSIVLENIKLSGNIIIQSDTLIKIKKTAFLKDLIIVAPIIELEEGTTGSFQAIASKRIIVNKNCLLEYPSALVLYQDYLTSKNDMIFKNRINIDENSEIRGCVCYFQKNKLDDYVVNIFLEKKSKIKGQVYCEGSFDLRGTVSGCVYTKQFITNEAGSLFINHIYNGTIENENVPNFYGGIVFDKDKKSIVKWLY